MPDPTAHEAMHTHHTMAGMATPEQMAELAAAEGTAFDRLFLKLMIAHHEGAVKMVEELLEQPGSAYDPVLFEFTNDVTNDQTAEIERMNALLVGLSADPRAGLCRPGSMTPARRCSTWSWSPRCPSPPGFFDPRNPAELPPKRLQAAEKDAGKRRRGCRPRSEDEEDARAPLLSFANTDMAFAGDVLVAGSYHGFNIYRLRRRRAAGARELDRLPGRPGRRLDRRRPADHVGRADPRAARLRARRGSPRTSATSASAASASSTSAT